MKKEIKRNIIKIFTIILLIIFFFVNSSNIVLALAENSNNSITNSEEIEEKQFCYLSDIPYQTGQTAWGKILLDKASNDGLISLTIEGNTATFKKGIFAHATSTLIYDIGQYDYDYFTAYLGVNTTSGNNGNGVKFYIYTSEDKVNWDLQTDENPIALKSADNAMFVKINIKGAKYLKLYAHDNGANGNDHSAYGDAKLIKEGYSDNVTKTVEEYDEIIKSKYTGEEINSDLELLILQRELVNNVGQYQLKTFIEEAPEHKETLEWLMNNLDILREYIIGGKPDGTYLKSLEVLSELYHTYGDDIEQNEIYKKMIISLSLSHSKTVRFWINDRVLNEDGTISTNSDKNSPNISNAVNRYKIYKEMYLAGKLNNNIFENLEVEEMRYIMSSDIPDDEIKWLRDYTELKGSTNPYSYLKYTTTVSYWNQKYYSAENRQAWDDKYNFSSYGIDYKSYYPRLWIVFEEGGVCWQISNTGQNIQSAYGIPSTTVGQPGHVAYLVYSLNSNGDGMWNLWNDVSGWTQTNRAGYANHTSYYNIRLMNGWGSGSYASPYMGSYMLLAQAAINDFEGYKTAEELLLLANTYSNDNTKQEEIYRIALKAQNINFDAWYGLVNLYVNDDTKTDADLYTLAKEITSSLKYYPLPMYDLLRIIFNNIDSTQYNVKLTLLQTRALTEASKATNAESIQANVVKIMANYLLGKLDTEIATFSFDGENAGVLSLATRYEGSNATWDYSLDGGNTWTQTIEHSVKLTEDELNSITVENDIKVHIIGTNYEEENIYTIDILKATLPTNLYRNDWENKIINATNTMEWKLNEDDEWTSFAKETPDLTGYKVVTVRVAANGIYLPSDTREYEFWAGNDTDTHKYIPIEHLSIHKVSSEATSNGGHAIHAIDGDINTSWHTAYNGTDTQRYIIIKLDNPVYVSALEYVPRQSGTNGRIKNGNVLVSMDGESWTNAGVITNWANNADVKEIVFEESIQAQYVKLEATANYGDGRSFASALIINLYEDVTKKTIPTAEVQYDITTQTNQNVTATLVNPSKEITITNNDGKDTYVFSENGEFTFEFIDKYGNKGSTTASVNWIIKNIEEDKIISKIYQIEEGFISKIKPGTKFSNFKQNIETNREVILMDKDGNVLPDDTKLATGMTLKVGTTLQYTIVVTGDIDKDGEITVNDLAKVKLHIIESQTLTGVNLKAADVDFDDEITINDLAIIKLVLIGLMEIN